MNTAVWFLTLLSVILIIIGLPFSFPWYSWCGIVYLAFGIAGLVGEAS